MHHSHFLDHLGKRPEGCRQRPRQCLLKDCQRLFWPRHWQCRYCSEACRQEARRWQRWRASQRYRASANGRQQRQEQSRRQRQRRRQRQAAAADEAGPREGQRLAPPGEEFSTRPCARPGCYARFAVRHEHSCQRFCSILCRLALRRVLQREERYRARRRQRRRQRVQRRGRPPDSS